jgi:tRNA-dihydrouridine synthase B
MQFPPLKIGNHQIDVPLILAPMAGVTDRPFRQLCKKMGAGLAVSEMVGSNSLIYGSEKTKRRANHEGETSPCSIQIVGSNPALMAEAARINADQGAEIIDINMGCPAKKICKVAAGSALMRDEKLVAEILEAVVQAVNIPVTLKIRTGWSPEHRNGIQIAQLAERCGVQALSVHGRTRACMFTGTAEYETIAAIKSMVKIPVIANGDITTPEEAQFVLEKTKADGIMIGRAAQGRPWIFREIAHFLQTGERLPDPADTEIRDIMLGHMLRLYEFYGEERGVLIARKHVSWYSKGQRSGGAFRHSFNQLLSAQNQIEAATEFFNQGSCKSEPNDLVLLSSNEAC